MMRPFLSLAAILLLLPPIACKPAAVSQDAADPDVFRQLSDLWSRSDPGKQLSPEEVEQIQILFKTILPDVSDMIPGSEWGTHFFDGESGDFFSVDLIHVHAPCG